MRLLRSILLTGGAGVIGSGLARHLLAKESLQRLVVLDKLTFTGNRHNLAGPDRDPRFIFVEGDIANRALVTELLRQHAITGVFNLAAESHLDRSSTSPGDFIASNITGTANLLEVCRAARVPLLQCSTDKVYGSVVPPDRFTEQHPLKPSAPYPASKAAADLLCLAAFTTYQQDLVITRCSSTFGPRQHHEKLIPTVIRLALRDQPIPLHGRGIQIRDWIHLDDHCRALLVAFQRGEPGEVYNFGGHCERTTLGLTRNILRILGKPESLISSVPERPGQDARRSVDTTKALRSLGWASAVKLPDALPNVVRELAANMFRPA